VIGAVVGTTVTFATATTAAVLVHLDVPATRRLVATQVTSILRGQLTGDVSVERIGALGLRGLSGVRVRVKDPTGMQVLFVDGVHVKVRGIEAAKSALFEKGPIRIPVDEVSVDHVDAAIDGDGSKEGNLRIAQAFQPKKPSPPTPPDPNSRGVRVDAPNVVLHHAWVHGAAPGAPPVDADVSQLVAHGFYEPKLVKADVDQIDLVTRNLSPKVDPRGRIVAHASIPLDDDPKNVMVVEAKFDGAVANVPTTAEAKMAGETIDAVVDLRGATGERVKPAFGELPIYDEVSAHAEVHGTTSQMRAVANVLVGSGTVDVTADADLRDGTKVEAKVAGRKLDARTAAPTAPPTNLNFDAQAKVALAKSGATSGDFTFDMLPSRLEGDDIPRIAVKGDFTKTTVRAKGKIDDARVPTTIAVAMSEIGGYSIVDAEVETAIPEISKLPKMRTIASGSATARVTAHANLEAKSFDAKAEIKGKNIDVSGGGANGQHVDDVNVLATAAGPFDQPVIEAGVHAGGIQAAGQKLGSADVRAKAAVGKTIVVRDVLVDLVKEGHTVNVGAKRVVVDGKQLTVDGATVRGLGEPINVDFTKDARSMRVKLDAPEIDLARVAKIAGRPGDVAKGTLALAGDVTLERDGAHGELHAKVASLRAHGIDDAKIDLDTKLDGKNVDVDLEGALGDAGTLSLHTRRFVIGGGPTDPASWAKAKGSAKISVDLDLKKAASLAPEGSLPVAELAGRFVVAGSIRRDSGDVPPELTLHGHTRGLVASGATDPEGPHGKTKVTGVAPWRSQGLDGAFDVKIDATSGFCEVGARAWDSVGTVAAFDAKSDLPYQELFSNPSGALQKMKNVPIVAKMIVPKRELARMPAILSTNGFTGTVEAELDVTGTPLEPKVAFVAHGRGVRSPSLPIDLATDADITLDYDGKAGDVLVKAKAGGHDAVELTAHADIDARDLVEGTNGELPWKGSAKVKLASFPLQTVGPLADLRVRGKVSGEAIIDDLHSDAKMHARIGFEDLKVGRARYKNGFVTADARDGKVEANVRLEQTDGFADIRAAAGLAWGAALAPALDESVPLDAKLEAKGFRAAAAAPFAKSVMNELDGRIDANATVHLDPKGKDAKLDGKVVFREGKVQLAALGDEMNDVRATVTLQPDGTIKVDDVFARSLDGQVKADAVVKLKGFALDSAQANVKIPKDHRFDFALQGAPIGEVAGDIHVNAKSSADGKKLTIGVDVPQFEVRLSDTMKPGVQALEEPEKIRVGTYRDANTFVKLPLDADDLEAKKDKSDKDEAGSTTALDVKLGDITVVYGQMARITLTGAPHVEIGAGAPKVSGQISVKQGKVDVQGKEFEVEKATVTFQEKDAGNPIVIATAGWEADDGSKIYADYVGPVKTGKVTLRSEPARPRNEILAIILFGTADGANAQPPPPGRAPDGTTKAAVGVGGGFAAQGLTEAMDDLTGVEATARIDSSRANNPAPEIEFQISRRVSLAVQHVLGTPPITDPDKNLATIDWRFRRNWSLETTFGDRGKAQMDAVWQKRY